MRNITAAGWKRIPQGFAPSDPPSGDPVIFWGWASREGSAFQLAAYFVLASAGASGKDFNQIDQERWEEVRGEATPLRLARVLDDKRRALVIDFIRAPEEMVD